MADTDAFGTVLLGPRQGQAQHAPAGTSAAVWAPRPTLGKVAGQSYWGRIVVEVWDTGGYSAYMGASQQSVGRAVAALQAAGSLPEESAVWPAGPIMGRQPADRVYQGRVVVELWEAATHVAGSVHTGAAADVVKRAIQALPQG